MHCRRCKEKRASVCISCVGEIQELSPERIRVFETLETLYESWHAAREHIDAEVMSDLESLKMTQRQQVWKEEGGVVSDGRQAQTRWIACRASLATGAGEREKASRGGTMRSTQHSATWPCPRHQLERRQKECGARLWLCQLGSPSPPGYR
jgi:hypothetical protein